MDNSCIRHKARPEACKRSIIIGWLLVHAKKSCAVNDIRQHKRESSLSKQEVRPGVGQVRMQGQAKCNAQWAIRWGDPRRTSCRRTLLTSLRQHLERKKNSDHLRINKRKRQRECRGPFSRVGISKAVGVYLRLSRDCVTAEGSPSRRLVDIFV